MKVLLVNKFLYRKGGSEEYLFQLAAMLQKAGVEVKFWGMTDKNNVVDDQYNCFADNIDFYQLKGLEKVRRSFETIYSFANRKKIAVILDAFKPDIVHIHNYNFQITPSILPEIKRRHIKVVQTAHDSQMVCPYHRIYNFQRQQICEKCINGGFYNCILDKCFDGSFFKSVIGASESYLYHALGYYNKYIDVIISPSRFLSDRIRKRIKTPIQVIPNFTNDHPVKRSNTKGDYILYFGRISDEKGILDIQNSSIWNRYRLIIVGAGQDQDRLHVKGNIEYVGPKYGDELRTYIAEARYVIQPAKGYENCPMAVIESFMCGTPVIGANKGGFVEMIEPGANGFLIDFSASNYSEELEKAFQVDPETMREHCRRTYCERYSPEIHAEKIMKIYQEVLS